MTTVSVLLTVYNGEQFLAKAIESVLEQSHRDFEFIVVNDGSTDSSKEIIEKYSQKDGRIVIVDQDNTGIIVALNNGLKACNGEYVARMDADDVCLPTRLEKQVEFLDKNPDVGVVGGSIEFIDSDDKVLAQKSYPLTDDEAKQALYNGAVPVAHPSAMYRKKLAEDIGGYRPFFIYSEDYDFWLRLSHLAKIGSINDVVLQYRLHDQNKTSHAKEGQIAYTRLALASYKASLAGQADPVDRFEGKARVEEILDVIPELSLKDLPKIQAAAMLRQGANQYRQGLKMDGVTQVLKAFIKAPIYTFYRFCGVDRLFS